jgi:hypothetical protein
VCLQNVNGKDNVRIAMTRIRGIGRRYSDVCLKKAEIKGTKRYVVFTERRCDAAFASSYLGVRRAGFGGFSFWSLFTYVRQC